MVYYLLHPHLNFNTHQFISRNNFRENRDSIYHVVSAVDEIQRKLHCCGVHNYTDWLKASSLHHPTCVPESCCKEKHSLCRGDLGHVEQLSEEGCLKKLEDQLCFSMLYIFWSCIVLSILEILAAVSNCILMRRHFPTGYFSISIVYVKIF
uniref:Uncharacterized protein n=1 Tax=Zonotrichia albicollis TaxID=44394 RepID=A0A8D2N3V9_ZONAL